MFQELVHVACLHIKVVLNNTLALVVVAIRMDGSFVHVDSEVELREMFCQEKVVVSFELRRSHDEHDNHRGHQVKRGRVLDELVSLDLPFGDKVSGCWSVSSYHVGDPKILTTL